MPLAGYWRLCGLPVRRRIFVGCVSAVGTPSTSVGDSSVSTSLFVSGDSSVGTTSSAVGDSVVGTP